MFDMVKLGAQLKEVRIQHQLTMKALGQIVGCNKSLISRWENGSRMPTVESLWTLADYYGISLDDLVGRNAGA